MNPATPALLKRHRSLRAKGLLATLSLLVYVLATGMYVSDERAALYRSVQSIEQLSRHEQALALADAAVRGALRENEGLVPSTPPAGPPRLDEVALRVAALEAFDPAHVLLQRAIERARQSGDAVSLHDALVRAGAALEIRRTRLADEHAALAAAFQRGYDAVTVGTLLLAIVGFAAFGTLAAWFFAGLSRDVRRLERHAQRIVQGARGIALPVQRSDELGQLMRAVDRMADELDAREQRIALDGQRHSHQDKMLAVAALAAGVAHEVNNPLAVIAGTAQLLQATGTPSSAELEEATETILAQTRRAATATRQLAEVAAPPPAERDWFDLNALVRRVVQWMGYDRRYRRVEFDLHMAPSLPAVHCAADVVHQILMQLLTLLCDARAGKESMPGRVTIVTLLEPGQGVVRIPAGDLDLMHERTHRTLVLARASLAPLGATLAFAQDAQGCGDLKLAVPLNDAFLATVPS